jgi:uncharacterized damage-inducible protein DinB
MPISQMLLPEFEQEMANTRKILERVPDGHFDYKPHPKSMPLGRLASHVAEMPSWAAHTIEQELLELEPGQQPFMASSTKELLEHFDKNVADARKKIAGVSDEELQKTWTMKFGGKEVLSMPRYSVLRTVVINHLIHHRAQLGVYLRLNEIEIPGMYGPSADEQKFWETKTA